MNSIHSSLQNVESVDKLSTMIVDKFLSLYAWLRKIPQQKCKFFREFYMIYCVYTYKFVMQVHICG